MNQAPLSIANRLRDVQSDIEQYAARYKRDPASVELLAVSKKKPVSAIKEAIAAGQRLFGENYVDEAIEKIQLINDPSISWHFIGAIQSRKTADIARHFDWAHGVDREKIVVRLSNQRPSEMSPLNICLQINIDNEETKAGVSIEQLKTLAHSCEALPGIKLRGLMAIPAPRDTLEKQREVFHRLKACLNDLCVDFPTLDTLSIGMSSDLEAAIAEGATMVRVGTAIFGTRD